MSRLSEWAVEWIKRNIIDDDPHEPEPTHGPDFDGRYYADDEEDDLDRMDGLVEQPSGLWINPELFAAMARKVNP